MSVLAVHTLHDGLLSVLAPLGLGAAAGTALVLDLDPDGIPLPSPRTVAEMVGAGPTLGELRPRRRGLAVLASGGAAWDDASELIRAFERGWPAVVVRTGAAVPVPVVPVVPLLPGVDLLDRPAVYQRTGLLGVEPGPGIVLPRPPARLVARLLRGAAAGGRWVRAWRSVWSHPWS